jgi:hypothetical protein
MEAVMTAQNPTDDPFAGMVAMPRLLTPREAAEALGKSPKWLEADRHSGPTIPFVRIGRSIRYRAEVIRDVVLRHEVEAA